MPTIKEIEEKLRQASKAYYNSDKVDISDADFDKLKNELQQLDPDNSFLKEIGAPVLNHLSKAKHNIPMGSLNNCSKDGDKANPSFVEWHEKINIPPVCVMHKLDGSSVELVYQKGKLVQAITRGDGFEGEVVVQNAKKFKQVPKTLKSQWSGSVRGEALLFIEDFNKYFEGQSNPRNVSNGTVRRSDGDKAQHITFIAYDIEGDFKTHEEKLRFIDALGFRAVWYRTVESTDEVQEIYEEHVKTRDQLPYEIDGLVCLVSDCADLKILGERDNRPKGGIAYKFSAMGASTKLLGVKLSLGHTGAVIPTADLEPVKIGGVTVSSALLNNYDEIDRLGIAIGDICIVVRAGDVVPKVLGVQTKSPKRIEIKPPTNCMACESVLVKVGVHWMCQNEECTGKNYQLLKTWVTKRDILHIGDDLLEELYNNHNVRQPADLYRLTRDYLAALPRGAGVVGSNADRIIAELDKSKKCPLSDFVGSLGIKLLGRRQAELMIEQGVDTLKGFLLTTEADFLKLDGFSDIKAREVRAGLVKAAGRIKALLDAGVVVDKVERKEVVAGGKLSGYIVCFTGVRPKPDEEEKFTSLGGVLKDSVSKVTHLVVKDLATTSNKAEKAKKQGTKVVDYAEFQGWLV